MTQRCSEQLARQCPRREGLPLSNWPKGALRTRGPDVRYRTQELGMIVTIPISIPVLNLQMRKQAWRASQRPMTGLIQRF